MGGNVIAVSKKRFSYLMYLNLLITGILAGYIILSEPELSDISDQVLRVRGIVVADTNGVGRVVIGSHVDPNPMLQGKRYKGGREMSGIMLYDGDGNERGGYMTGDWYGNMYITLDDLGGQRAMLLVEPQGAASFSIGGGNNVFNVLATRDTTIFRVLNNGKEIN